MGYLYRDTRLLRRFWKVRVHAHTYRTMRPDSRRTSTRLFVRQHGFLAGVFTPNALRPDPFRAVTFSARRKLLSLSDPLVLFTLLRFPEPIQVYLSWRDSKCNTYNKPAA